MQKACLYETRAEDAERLARIAQTDEERLAYLQIAAVWREISRTRRQLLEGKPEH
ncbi:hypothetical protein [Caulobacter sp. 17J80-11]|uniref:hypothetical protein n=1 Tax=Caulobacter sp. 17J80-11 TaxID=2763502 RepID=UPI0016537EAC|nr:hypothetical protein [Caulobacter sp. 17J80-11]MBC6982733.1 hypothetical protein [Caulobacter sp. 17J80-11]